MTNQPPRKPKKKQVIAITMLIHECDGNGKLKKGGKVESLTYDVINEADPEHRVTAVFFGNNAVENIFAPYYEDNIYSDKPIMVEDTSPLVGLDLGNTIVRSGMTITPNMMKKHWAKEDVIVMVKCANSQICQ